MAMVTGGQLVARMLKEEGVRHVFTLSGLHVAPIYAGLVEEGIAVVDTRHEQAAAHAADAYARLTRGVGVAVVTAGPGVTDAAHRRGQRLCRQLAAPPAGRRRAASSTRAGAASRRWSRWTSSTGITKWSDRVPVPRARARSTWPRPSGWRCAGRPGPVFLELAWDVLCNGVDEAALQMPPVYRTRGAACAPGIRWRWTRRWRCSPSAERPALHRRLVVWWDDAVERARRASPSARRSPST